MTEGSLRYGLPALGEDDPHEVARPGTVEEVSEALRDAWEARASVRPWGGGTQMALGLPILPAPERVVDLTRLDAMVEHRPDDMTVTVQAGVRWADLRARLAETGHELPFDPPAPPEATVGGMTAVGLSGPRRFAHGRLRDWVLGVQIVRPDGTVTRAGGRVVKNVSGYELTKLYTGSLGTLGVLTEVTYKTRPQVPSRRAVAVPLPGFDALEGALAGVMDSSVEPAFLEAFWMSPGVPGSDSVADPTVLSQGPFAARALAAVLNLPADAAGAGLTWLLVGFEGTERRTAWQVDELGRLLTSARERLNSATARDVETGPATRFSEQEFFRPRPLPWDEVHQALISAYRLPAPAESDEANFYASLQSGQVASYLAAVDRVARRRSLHAAAFAHGGNGGVAVHASGAPDALIAAGQELRAEAAGFHGSLVFRHGPLAVRQALSVWGAAPPTLPLMRALKEQLDPRRVLNPGRFLGGL